MAAVAKRIGPVLAQLVTSLGMALDRMQGLTDPEFFWAPSANVATATNDEAGRLRPVPSADDGPRTRTIALLAGHLVEIALLPADYTDGEHRLTRDDIEWPANAEAAIALLGDSWARWRTAVAGVRESDLDIVGRCDFPGGLDTKLPIIDIIWWMNRELIHHTAEIAFVRDLYASRV